MHLIYFDNRQLNKLLRFSSKRTKKNSTVNWGKLHVKILISYCQPYYCHANVDICTWSILQLCANLETQQIKKIEKKIYIMSNDQDSLAAAGMFETEVCSTNYFPGELSVSNYVQFCLFWISLIHNCYIFAIGVYRRKLLILGSTCIQLQPHLCPMNQVVAVVEVEWQPIPTKIIKTQVT